jgi:TRAP-type C4-dicarboxylate transport system substrate-binding protein
MLPLGAVEGIDLGPKIRLLRKAEGWSLASLSRAANISVGHLSKIETGRINPKIPLLMKIASALGRPMTFFFQSAAEIPRSLATVVAVMGPEAEAVTSFSRLVEERSNGLMKLQILPSAGLNVTSGLTDTLLSGAIDTVIDVLAFYQNYAEILRPASLPFCFRGTDHYEAFLRSDLFREGFVEALLNKGVRFLDPQSKWRRTPQVLLSNRPIFRLDDLRGMKIRVYNSDLLTEFWDSFGARPVFVPWLETYRALEERVVDCVVVSAGLLPAAGFAQVAKYATCVDVCDAMVSTVTIAVNEERYQLLPPAIQKILFETAGEIAQDVTATLARCSEHDLAQCRFTHDLVVSKVNLAPFRKRAWDVIRSLEKQGRWEVGLFDALQNICPVMKSSGSP